MLPKLLVPRPCWLEHCIEQCNGSEPSHYHAHLDNSKPSYQVGSSATDWEGIKDYSKGGALHKMDILLDSSAGTAERLQARTHQPMKSSISYVLKRYCTSKEHNAREWLSFTSRSLPAVARDQYSACSCARHAAEGPQCRHRLCLALPVPFRGMIRDANPTCSCDLMRSHVSEATSFQSTPRATRVSKVTCSITVMPSEDSRA